jgi:hypothetical protein
MRRILCVGGWGHQSRRARAAVRQGRRIALAGAAALALILGMLAAPGRAHAETVYCNGTLTAPSLKFTLGERIPVDSQPDLEVSSACTVKPGDYYFGEVNIIKGGTLTFEEGPASMEAKKNRINFWAKSIIIEKGGAMTAGVDGAAPFGTNNGTLDIVLYGADQTNGQRGVQGKGALCVSPPYVRGYKSPDGQPVPDCGIPKSVWDTNGSEPVSLVNDAPGGGQSRQCREGLFLPVWRDDVRRRADQRPGRAFRLQGARPLLWRDAAAARLQGYDRRQHH